MRKGFPDHGDIGDFNELVRDVVDEFQQEAGEHVYEIVLNVVQEASTRRGLTGRLGCRRRGLAIDKDRSRHRHERCSGLPNDAQGGRLLGLLDGSRTRRPNRSRGQPTRKRHSSLHGRTTHTPASTTPSIHRPKRGRIIILERQMKSYSRIFFKKR